MIKKKSGANIIVYRKSTRPATSVFRPFLAKYPASTKNTLQNRDSDGHFEVLNGLRGLKHFKLQAQILHHIQLFSPKIIQGVPHLHKNHKHGFHYHSFWLMYVQVWDFCISRGPLQYHYVTRISCTTVFSKSQNARKAGTLCIP